MSEISLFAILGACLKSDFGSSFIFISFLIVGRSGFRLSARYSCLYSLLPLGSRFIETLGIGGCSAVIFSSLIFGSLVNCFGTGLAFSDSLPFSLSFRLFSFLLFL